MERALSFGAVAEAYERFRPGYPTDVVRLALGAADGPVLRALEVGAGTGKATRVFAAAGIEVVASEPDGAMLGVLTRECAGLSVTPLLGAFESLDAVELGTFDLLYAAAAWHWTSAATRWDRAAALVRPGGAVAFFGGPFRIADEAVEQIEAQALAPYLPAGADVPPPSPGAGDLDWPGDEMLADPRFTDVRQQTLPRRLVLTREDYLGHLDTISAFRMLLDADRLNLYADLRAALPSRIPLVADLAVHTARRR